MKLPFRLIASLVALMLVCSSGCSDFDFDFDFPAFTNPTVEPEEAKTQKALYGSYIVSENVRPKDPDPFSSSTTMFHVGKAEDGFPDGFLRMACVYIGFDGKMEVDDSGNLFFATKIDDFYVLNMPTLKETDEDFDEFLNEDFDEVEEPQEKVLEWDPENYEGYMLLVLKPTQEGFAMYLFDTDRLKAEVEAGRLSGDYMTEEEKDEYKKQKRLAKKAGKKIEDTWRPFTINASPRELRAFIEERLDNVIELEPYMLFKRVK